jgi:hypothetical protein
MVGRYIAKIVGEQKLENNQLWKYDFLDIETNKQDYFYHDKQINYTPNVVGKLNITEDKFFQSFQQDLINTNKESKGEQSLTDFEKQSIESIDKISRKNKNVSVDFQHLRYLRELGFSYKDLAKVYKKCERTNHLSVI